MVPSIFWVKIQWFLRSFTQDFILKDLKDILKLTQRLQAFIYQYKVKEKACEFYANFVQLSTCVKIKILKWKEN